MILHKELQLLTSVSNYIFCILVMNWCKLPDHVEIVLVVFAAVGILNKAMYVIFLSCLLS